MHAWRYAPLAACAHTVGSRLTQVGRRLGVCAGAVIFLYHPGQFALAPDGNPVSSAPFSVGNHVLHDYHRHPVLAPTFEVGAVFVVALWRGSDAVHRYHAYVAAHPIYRLKIGAFLAGVGNMRGRDWCHEGKRRMREMELKAGVVFDEQGLRGKMKFSVENTVACTRAIAGCWTKELQ